MRGRLGEVWTKLDGGGGVFLGPDGLAPKDLAWKWFHEADIWVIPHHFSELDRPAMVSRPGAWSMGLTWGVRTPHGEIMNDVR